MNRIFITTTESLKAYWIYFHMYKTHFEELKENTKRRKILDDEILTLFLSYSPPWWKRRFSNLELKQIRSIPKGWNLITKEWTRKYYIKIQFSKAKFDQLIQGSKLGQFSDSELEQIFLGLSNKTW